MALPVLSFWAGLAYGSELQTVSGPIDKHAAVRSEWVRVVAVVALGILVGIGLLVYSGMYVGAKLYWDVWALVAGAGVLAVVVAINKVVAARDTRDRQEALATDGSVRSRWIEWAKRQPEILEWAGKETGEKRDG